MTTTLSSVLVLVRKHPAPEGALKHILFNHKAYSNKGQKAPSTRRPNDGTYKCILTPLTN